MSPEAMRLANRRIDQLWAKPIDTTGELISEHIIEELLTCKGLAARPEQFAKGSYRCFACGKTSSSPGDLCLPVKT